MPVSMSDPYVQKFCARAQLRSSSDATALAEQIDAACRPMAGGTDAVLEISSTGLHKTADGHALGTVPVLLVIFRFELAIVRARGVFNRTWEVERVEYAAVNDVLADQKSFGNKSGEFAIQFTGAGAVPIFRLAWTWFRRALSDGVRERLTAAEERDRILSAILAAKAGDFTPWGQVVSKPEEFAEDFQDAYARLVSEGPDDPYAVRSWAAENIGTSAYPSALASAIDWRCDELDDRRPRQERGGNSARVARVAVSGMVTEEIPAAIPVFLKLGEMLYDAAEMAGPYNERSYFGPDVNDEPDRELDVHDQGPRRLTGLIMLAVYAHQVNHPRRTEWIEAARKGLATVKPGLVTKYAYKEWLKVPGQ